MTRDRLPVGPVLQRAYGVLDKYQISRTFFIKTDQNNCDAVPPAFEAYDPTEPSPPLNPVTENKKKSESNEIKEKSVVEPAINENDNATATVQDKQQRSL